MDQSAMYLAKGMHTDNLHSMVQDLPLDTPVFSDHGGFFFSFLKRSLLVILVPLKIADAPNSYTTSENRISSKGKKNSVELHLLHTDCRHTQLLYYYGKENFTQREKKLGRAMFVTIQIVDVHYLEDNFTHTV